jgi:tetratricopeptide (TPR) repeat protein
MMYPLLSTWSRYLTFPRWSLGQTPIQGVCRERKSRRTRRIGNTLADVLLVTALIAILVALFCSQAQKKDVSSAVHTRLHLGLGNRLVREGKLDEAVAAYHKALARHPDLALSYLHLANALARQKAIPAGNAALRRALVLAPDPACAYDNLVSMLGLASSRQRNERDVVAAYRKAVELHGNDRRNHIFGSAAAAAALAASGPESGALTLNTRERAQLRQQALAWLRADLAGLRDWLETAPKDARQEVRAITQWRQQDPDFAGVRDGEALARLPEAERQEWQTLWADVDKLRRDAVAKDTPESQLMDQ